MLFASSRTDSESIRLDDTWALGYDGRRFRPLVKLIDWLVIVLGAFALLTGLLALLGSLYTTDGEGIDGLGGSGIGLHRWQLAVLLVAFTGLVVLNLTGSRRAQRVSSRVTLVLAMFAFVGWWWAEIDVLLTPTNIDAASIALGGGTILTRVSLVLQMAVGLLMFTAAFPLAAVLSARRRRSIFRRRRPPSDVSQ
jgi:hypothetical protein